MEEKQRAAKYHQDRVAAEMANHAERIEWLSADAPRWSCGELVCAHMRNALLAQSRAALAKAGI